MKSRERVYRAIKFQKPDRAPISHAVLPAAQLKYGQALAEILVDYQDDFGWDYMCDLATSSYPAQYCLGRNEDDFGTVWQSEHLGMCGIPVDWPIKDLAEYSNYTWPEVFSVGPPLGRIYSGHMQGKNEHWYARGAWITFFEQLQQLRGMENLMIDIAGESSAFNQLLDDMQTFNMNWINRWVQLEYDGLHFADDWGGQHRMLIKPDTWRRVFKPRYREMFQIIRQAGMHIWFHSDGCIHEILEDLIEIGVDVINCQVKCIGLDWIAANIRGKIAIRTDIDRQFTLPYGSAIQVKEEVHRVFEACGTATGGVIACGEIGPDVPLENITAMYEAFREYG